MVFLDNISKPLLMMHLVAAVLLAGASTHNLMLLPGLMGGNARSAKLAAKYTALTLYAFVSCFVLGMVIYPAFRYYVRAQYLDKAYPRATGLFEIKEHLLSLALVLAVANFVLCRGGSAPVGAQARRLYAFGVACCWAITVYAFASGALLTMLRSI